MVLNPVFDPRFAKEVNRRLDAERRATEGLTQDYVTRLQRQARLAPYLSPRTLMNSARYDVDDETLSLMNNGIRESSLKSNQTNAVLDAGRKIVNPIFDAIGSTVSFVVNDQYNNLKTASRYLTAAGESGLSFVNNYLLERGISEEELASRFGKLLAAPALLFQDDDMRRAAKYTELGNLIRNRDREGNGFFMPAQLQFEQMLEVMGIGPDGQPVDYAGRVYFDDAYVKAPIPEMYGRPQMMKQPATIGAFITAVPRKIRPDGAITSYKGLNPDSAAGSFLSGSIDGFLELVSDLSAAGIAAVKGSIKIAKGARIATQVSPERVAATEGLTTIGKWLKLGKTANDLPSTTRSWSEIQEARRVYGEDVASIRRARAAKSITAKEEKNLLDMRDTVLKEAESDVWNKDALSEMIRTDSRFGEMFDLLDSSRVIKNIDERAFSIRNKIFRNEISLEAARELAQQSGKDGYREVFLRFADSLGMGETVLPEKITDFGGRSRRVVDKITAGKSNIVDFDRYVMPPGLAWGAIKPGVAPVTKTALYAGKVGLDISSFRWVKDRFRHMFRVSPQVEIMINGSAGQRADAVDDFFRWSKNLLPDTTDELYLQKVMGRVAGAMTNKPRQIERMRRGKLITETVFGEASRAGIKAVEEIGYEVMDEYMKKQGLDKSQIREVIQRMRDVRASSRTYAIANGLPTDYGQLQRLATDGLIDLKQIANDIAKDLGIPVSPRDLEIIGPAVIQEAYNNVMTLPDWRMLKSIVEGRTGIGKLVRNPQTGNLRLLPNAADVIVNDVWKPLTLANLGYFARNILEGQFRLFLGSQDDVANLFHRPFTYWRVIRNKVGVMDLMGKYMTQDEIEQLAQKTFDTLTPAEKNLSSISNAQSWGYSRATLDSMTHLVKTNQVKMINKASTSEYRNAALDAVRKLNSDPLEAMLSRLSHLPLDRQVDAALEYLYKSEQGVAVQQRFLEMAQEYGLTVGAGSKIGDYPIGAQTLAKLDLKTPKQRRAFFKGLIETQIRGRVETMSKVAELRPMIGQNAIPKLGSNNKVIISTQRINNAIRANVERWAWGDKPVDENMIGGIFYNPGLKTAYYIDDVVRSGPKGNVLTAKLIELVTTPTDLVKKRDFDFVTGWAARAEGYGPEAENVMRALLDSTDKGTIRAFPPILPSFTRVAKDISGLRNQWRSLIDGLFSGVMGKGVNVLEKLPAYRQYKWAIYEEYYDSLSGVAINDAVKLVQDKAKEIGMSPDDFMGGVKGRFENLYNLKKKTNALKAGYDIEQMDRFASSLAEKRMRGLFYDMPQKLNLETTAGVSLLFQFIAASRVIMTDMARLSVKNPNKVYRAVRTFNGAMDLDLPGDTERGAVYTHPVTGKYVFRHPFGLLSKGLVDLFTGVETDGAITPILESNVQGLNIGLVGIPQANPVGQVGIGKVFDLAQKFSGGQNQGIEELRKTFMPFESFQQEKSMLERLTPNWLYKAGTGLSAIAFGTRTDALTREIHDAAAGLSLTGRYDLNTVDGMEKLEKDATQLALFMYMAGAITTFTGPASATPEYIATLNGMDVHSGSMAAELQKMRDIDPDGAALRWIDVIGEEALLYLSGKTQMSKDARGILYTPQYLLWLKGNQSLVDKYGGSVAHFFGPQEDVSEYEFGMRSYLLQGGKARYASIPERVLAAQYVIASSYYRAIRNQLPTFLNDEQTAQLKVIREDLSDKYRGFTAVKYSVESFDTNIKAIKLILDEGSFTDSELVAPLQTYMTYRDAFLSELAKYGLSSFRSKRAAPFRARLDSIGEELSRQNRSFQRLYDNLLSSETNPAGTE